jgi:hypothetical protein
LVQGNGCVKWVKKDFQRLRALVHILAGRISRRMMMDAWREASLTLTLPICDDDCECGECTTGAPPPLPITASSSDALPSLTALCALSLDLPLCDANCACDFCVDPPSSASDRDVTGATTASSSTSDGVSTDSVNPSPSSPNRGRDLPALSLLAPTKLLAIAWHVTETLDPTDPKPPPPPLPARSDLQTSPVVIESTPEDDVTAPLDDLAPHAPPPSTPARSDPQNPSMVDTDQTPELNAHVDSRLDALDSHPPSPSTPASSDPPASSVSPATPQHGAVSPDATSHLDDSDQLPEKASSTDGATVDTQTETLSPPNQPSQPSQAVNQPASVDSASANHAPPPSPPVSIDTLKAALDQLTQDFASYREQAKRDMDDERVRLRNSQRAATKDLQTTVSELQDTCDRQGALIDTLQRKCAGLEQSLKHLKKEKTAQTESAPADIRVVTQLGL